MFARENRRKARIGDYDPIFRNLLERGKQIHPEFFTTGVVIGDFSLRRGPRRGATTEAENNNVDTEAIELTNQRKNREAARGSEAGISMQQVYTRVSRAVELL